MKTNIYVEFYGEQISQDEVIESIKKTWLDMGFKADALKKIEIYIKPEDNRVYYVCNDDYTGSFAILSNSNDF